MFEKLFNPRGIAIIGASGDLTRMAGQTVRALREFEFPGGVYPVNPKYQEIGGYRCYASVAAIDGPVDVAVIALPGEKVPAVIDECGAKGISHAVVLSGGFREIGGEGIPREQEMLAAARKHGLRIIGPNCIGVVNVYDRVFAAFASMTRPPHLKRGCVSVIVQSGGFGMTMVIRAAVAGVGFRYLVASGGESDVTTPEMINAYVDDPETKVILAYVEGMRDGRAFMAAAERARAAGKPILLWKGGRAEQGAVAAASHTASLTGTYDIFRACFRQCGIIEVTDVDEVVDFIRSFLSVPLPQGKNAAVMTNTGGCAVAFCDTADEVGIRLHRMAPHTMEVMKENLPSLSSLVNPIDYTAGRPRPQDAPTFLKAFTAVLNDPKVDQLGMLFGTVVGAPFRLGSELLAEAAKSVAKPIFVFSAVPPEISSVGWDVLEKAGIPVMPTPMRMAKTMAMLGDYASAKARPPLASHESGRTFDVPALPTGAVTLDEQESKALISAAGIPVTADVVLPADVSSIPAGLAYPLAVKILSRDIAHKTDIGGVRLGVKNADELKEAAAAVLANARTRCPDAKIRGVLVSEMASGGVETIIGVVNDPAFGPVVVLGLGGVLTEVLKDVSYRIAPFGRDDAMEMIDGLRAAKVFDGVRGRPACDKAALADALVAISRLAWQLRDRIAEIDVNPVLVKPAGAGIQALDALVVLR